jgi:hypothetical protein
MRIVKKSNYRGFEDEKDSQNYARGVDSDLTNLFLMSQGRVRFGAPTDGTAGENICGEFQVFTSDGTADNAFSVAHGLSSTPHGYIVLKQNKAGSLYDSGTTWTTSDVNFKCDTASVDFTIFLIK